MYCTRCKKRLAKDGFKQCDECVSYKAAAMRRLRAREPERMTAYKRDWDYKQRRAVLDHYGGRCACCGEDQEEFLSIDHINGGGSKQRRETNFRGTTMYRWLIRNNFPDGFRVLCHNCNQAIGFYGKCPHERVALEVIKGAG